MRQCGRVVKIEGETVTVFPDGARCAGCSGGHCRVAGRTVRVSNSDGHQLSLSDRVEIGSSFRQGVLDFFLLILLPLGGALFAAFPLSRLFGLQGGVTQVAMGLLTAILLLGCNLLRGGEQRKRSLPQVVSVLRDGPENL